MRRRRRTRRRGRRRQRRDENPPQSLFRFVLPFRGKRSVQVVRRRRGRDAGRRDERREASREVVRLRGGGRDLRVQRARRRRGGRVPPLPRVLALVSEQERRELGLEGRGDSRPAEARVVVEVRRVVRRRVPQRAARQREGRQRDTRAPHVARRAFVPSRAPEDESIPGRRARVEPDDVFLCFPRKERGCAFSGHSTRARAPPSPFPSNLPTMKHRVPEAVLPSHGAGVGPFAPRGAPRTPAPAVVYLACFGCAVFLVLCVVSEHGVRESEPDVRGDGGGRRLTQWLAPVWYTLPTLFDSLYNLVRPRAPSASRDTARADVSLFPTRWKRLLSLASANTRVRAKPGPTSSSCRRSTASPRRPPRARRCFARPRDPARARRSPLPRTPPPPPTTTPRPNATERRSPRTNPSRNTPTRCA